MRTIPSTLTIFLTMTWALALLSVADTTSGQTRSIGNEREDLPQLIVDAYWPKPLPNNWIVGQVAGVAVGPDDHVWIVHRPDSLSEREIGATVTPPLSNCCMAAPPVLEFDLSGNLVRGWGGPDHGYDWPGTEHGIFIDDDGFVWLAGNGPSDRQILKFTPDGRFLMQIGRPGESMHSNDTENLGRPADLFVDLPTNEVFVADGYGNRRIVVFDATTGTYKRHWGAYGNPPRDDPMPPYTPTAPPAQQFRNPAHCVQISRDGLVYVCDRVTTATRSLPGTDSSSRRHFSSGTPCSTVRCLTWRCHTIPNRRFCSWWTA